MSAAVSRPPTFVARSECVHVPASAKGIAYCANCGEVLIREAVQDDDREIAAYHALILAETLLELAMREHRAAFDELQEAVDEIELARDRARHALATFNERTNQAERAAGYVVQARELGRSIG